MADKVAAGDGKGAVVDDLRVDVAVAGHGGGIVQDRALGVAGDGAAVEVDRAALDIQITEAGIERAAVEVGLSAGLDEPAGRRVLAAEDRAAAAHVQAAAGHVDAAVVPVQRPVHVRLAAALVVGEVAAGAVHAAKGDFCVDGHRAVVGKGVAAAVAGEVAAGDGKGAVVDDLRVDVAVAGHGGLIVQDRALGVAGDGAAVEVDRAALNIQITEAGIERALDVGLSVDLDERALRRVLGAEDRAAAGDVQSAAGHGDAPVVPVQRPVHVRLAGGLEVGEVAAAAVEATHGDFCVDQNGAVVGKGVVAGKLVGAAPVADEVAAAHLKGAVVDDLRVDVSPADEGRFVGEDRVLRVAGDGAAIEQVSARPEKGGVSRQQERAVAVHRESRVVVHSAGEGKGGVGGRDREPAPGGNIGQGDGPDFAVAPGQLPCPCVLEEQHTRLIIENRRSGAIIMAHEVTIGFVHQLHPCESRRVA